MFVLLRSSYLKRACELVIIFRIKPASLGKSGAFESSPEAEYCNNVRKSNRYRLSHRL